MKGTRKNVGFEYKNWVKWGFVPKLGVVLLAALVILSLASCKNTVDGGVSSYGSGSAPATGDTSSTTPSLDSLPDDIVEDDSSLGVSTYKFFVDGNQIGLSRGVKLQGEVTFAKILEKANLNEDDYKDELFDGWKVRDSDGNAIGDIITNDMDFSVSTNFMAVYRDPPKYKDSVSKEDILGCGWYSSETKSHLVFSEDMYAYEVTGKEFVAADAIIKDYFDKEDKRSRNEITSDELTNYANENFSHQYSWLPDESLGAWNNDWETAKGIYMFDFYTGFQAFYYISSNGNELLTIDAAGNTKTVYEKIKR